MDIIEHVLVSLLLSRNFQVIQNGTMEAHMTLNKTRILYGDDMFLTTILLKLSVAVNGHYWTLSCLLCNKVAIFMQFSAPMEAHIGLKEHRNAFMVMKCFCLQYYWNIRQLLTVYCTSISTHATFQCSICASQHESMVDYTGHFRTYEILSFCRFLSSYECKNEKWPTGYGVNFRLYQNMSNFMINYESVSVRPCFGLNPQPDPSTLNSYRPNVGIFEIK